MTLVAPHPRGALPGKDMSGGRDHPRSPLTLSARDLRAVLANRYCGSPSGGIIATISNSSNSWMRAFARVTSSSCPSS